LENFLNRAVRDVQFSGIRTFANLVAQVPDAISLTIGQPDFPTPQHIKDAAKHAIDDNRTTYTHNAGMIELRIAAAAYVRDKYSISYHPETETIVTHGVSEAIDITLRTVLEPGCEVILPGPVYPGYEPIIRMMGAQPVYVDTRPHGFRLTAEGIAEKLSAKTRCVILPYPANPTGCVLRIEDVAAIAELLHDKNIFVLSDEIYSELTYDRPHVSIAAFPGMRDKTVVVNGLSKSHAMTGWRIGFAFGPAYVMRHMLKVHQYNVTCPTSISQYAALAAVTKGADDAREMRNTYRDRRDYVVDRLTDLGLDVVRPAGAFYVFPAIRQFGLTSQAFATRLLTEGGLAVVPGDAFSAYGEGHVRISYAYAMPVLEAGLNRLAAFLGKVR